MILLKCAALFLLLSSPCVVFTAEIYGSEVVREARLVGGGDCEGRLEIRPDTSSPFGQACDLNRGDTEAMVACRMLGCNTEGAQRVDPLQFGFDVSIFRGFGATCTGDENSLSECRQTGSHCGSSAEFAVAIDCNGSSKTNAGSVFIVFSLGVLVLIYNTMK